MLPLDDGDYNYDEEERTVKTDNRYMQYILIMGLIIVFMWSFSLVLNIITASKLNYAIAHSRPNLTPKNIKCLLDTMAASFAMFWYPFVNVGLSLGFAIGVSKIK
jgi:hypothetical protein